MRSVDLGAAEERVLLVGATEHGADVMLPGLTAALGERLPDWRLRFRLDRNVMLADAIEHGVLDVAVMLDGSGLDPANAAGVVELKWVSSRSFSVPASAPLPVVMFAEPCVLREPTFSALDRIGVDYRIGAESADLFGLFAAVRSGLGVALLPMIGKLPDGLCLAEGLPPTNRASVFVRGRAGFDAEVAGGRRTGGPRRAEPTELILDSDMKQELVFEAPRRAMPPQHFADLDEAARAEAVTGLGLPAFRAKQLANQYYGRLIADPHQMTDLPAAVRDQVAGELFPDLLNVVRTVQCDAGETRKTLWRGHDGTTFESVLMRYPQRNTVCISSQAGCGMACPFCATGQGGLTRNLSTAEILEQVRAASSTMRAEHDSRLSNIVFMGMGEPLANYNRVLAAVQPHHRPAAATASASRPARSRCRPWGWRPPSASWPTNASASRWRCHCTPPTTNCATPWCRSTTAGMSAKLWTPQGITPT